MPQNPQAAVRLRPIDLARAHGLSAQAVRNYEADGILPPAGRTASGYRTYTPRHARALGTFRALVPGHGHHAATAIMRAVHGGMVEEALRLVDEGHTVLAGDRRTLRAVEAALTDLAAVPAVPAVPTVPAAGIMAAPAGRTSATVPAAGDMTAGDMTAGDMTAGDMTAGDMTAGDMTAGDMTAAGGRGEMFVGPLAGRLGVRPATLRKWEAAGLVTPRRDRRTGYRVYAAADVRDARLVHQLRRGGYRLAAIAPVIAQVRAAGGVAPLAGMLADWQARLTARGRALLSGAAALDAYLREFS
ncbi:TioE family transcriptional regulator [Actinoplanes sp. CA-030573]|uniref:TioE family transcriptional regulator n=1 Tax=Actinoplanes sp. CA-030573 TaxID=3239898 RepID=UPI003D8B12F4